MSECTCTPCRECKGRGTVWYSLSGKYLGSNRCDDMDEFDVCEECGGTCVEDVCDYCREIGI